MADVARDLPLEHEHVLSANVRQARIARVYAESLLAVATEQGQAEAIGDEMEAMVRDVLDPNPQVAAFLGFPAISRRRRGPILEAALKGNVSPLLERFIEVLNQNNRLNFFRSVVAAYRDLLDERAGRVRVVVRSAVPLTADQQAELRKTLAASLKKEPVLALRTEPELLGGMVVQVGDKVYDTSVRTRLDALRAQLISRGTNVAKA
jgi:F-type H+-transporting ATPase subunit delta